MWSRHLRRYGLRVGLGTLLVLMILPRTVFSQSAGEEQRVRIAVLDFKLVGVGPLAGALMIDKLRSDLVNTQRFIVLDRAQSDKITEELARQQTGLTNSETSTKIGEQFNVARIVTGRVVADKSLGLIQVNVEMIEMRTAQIVVSRTITYDGEMKGFILTKVPEIVALIAGKQPEKPVVQATPPLPPQGLEAAEGVEGENAIVWRSVEDAVSYNLYFSTLPGVNRGTSAKFSAVTSPYRHTGLVAGTTYYYIVTAENEAGESEDSMEVSATTLVPTQPLVQQPLAAEPEVAAETSTWPKTLGITLLVAAGVAQLVAFATSSSAEDDAALALENDDADAYQAALDDRDSAEGIQGLAAVMGIVGVIFLIVHGASGPDGSDSAAVGPGREGLASGFGIDVNPRAVMAGYTVRW